MRRSDREITDFQELITVMRGCDVCRLALHDEPYPYILPLNFGLEADGETVRLYFHGANTGTKYDLIAKIRMSRSRWTAGTRSSSTMSTATAP